MIRPSLRLSDDDLRRAIQDFGPKVDGYIHATMDYQSGNVLKYAKTNAPWRDRTGNARSGLSVEVGWEPMVRHSIDLFHRVTYGIFLEVRWAGRYAIIAPTIQKYGPDTMRLFNKLFSKLKLKGGA